MDPRHLYMDERLTGMCVYCGAQPDTRDHVPSKVLIDEPYPPFLPVVNSCKNCNLSFSLDEQYLACFIECVICDSVEITDLQRPKIKRIFSENPSLQQRIKNAKRMSLQEAILWKPENDRIRNVVLKLAKGHAAYELNPIFEEPRSLIFIPILMLTENQRIIFESLNSEELNIYPEMGSRAFLRVFGKNPDPFERSGDWIIVQPGRYRYSVVQTNFILVRMVLSEYLACEVLWEE